MNYPPQLIKIAQREIRLLSQSLYSCVSDSHFAHIKDSKMSNGSLKSPLATHNSWGKTFLCFSMDSDAASWQMYCLPWQLSD